MCDSEQPLTFKDKLIHYYISNKVGYNSRNFYAFVIVLQGIGYNYSRSFCKAIRQHASKDRITSNYNILLGLEEIELSRNFMNKYKHLEFTVFSILLDLNIKISKQLRDKIAILFPDPFRYSFECYCEAYFEAIRTHQLGNILKYNRILRDNWFKKEADASVIRARFADLPDLPPYKADYSDFNVPAPIDNFSKNDLTRIIFTPMGGQNRRY